MKSEFLLAFNEICSDRGLARAVVLDAVENALVSAYRRNIDANTVENVSARIDPSTGEAKIFVQKEVVEEISDPTWEITLPEAQRIDVDAELGELVTVEDTPDNFGRIAAQTAKQVILQRIREAERDAQFDHYVEQEGEIVHGTVQSVRPNVVLVNLGGAEAILPRSQQVPGERYHIHQRLRAYVLEVRNTNRGPKIVSRSHQKMLRRLLELEVPEIFNGTVEIKAIAREAGSRSKVAVAARQPGVDPVGACVGMRGVRIKSIVNELGGEKIDVIEWSPETSTFIAKALSPAKVLSVQLDEDPDGRMSASVVVPDDQLSLAIGRAGQNARLAAKLSDHRIDIQGVTEAATWALKRVNEDPDVLPSLGQAAELLPSVASILQQHETERDMPYSSEELLKMRRVIESVRKHYLSLRQAEREHQQAEEEARREAFEQAREVIPAKAYDTTIEEMELSARTAGRLEEVGLGTAGEVMERLIAEGDEGLLNLEGIGPKTLERVKKSITEHDLLEGEPVSAQDTVPTEEEAVSEEEPETLEEAARREAREAFELAREVIPAKAYETTIEEMELGTRITERLEEVGLGTAGEVMERLIAEGDEGLLALEGIGPKTLERVKESITEHDLLEGESVAAREPVPAEEEPEAGEEAAPPELSTEAVEQVEEKPDDEEEKLTRAEMLRRAMMGGGEEEVTDEEPEIEEEPESSASEFFFEDGEPIDREEKLKRERRRRVQLVFDEETGELIPRRRRKREEDAEEWSGFIDY